MRTKRIRRRKKRRNQMPVVHQSTNFLAKFLNDKYEPKSREKVIQQRVLRDIGLLIPPREESMTADKIKFYLGHLQGKINQMDLRPYWLITPAEIALKGLRPGERVCEIFGTRWVVSKRPFSSDVEKEVYLAVISSLESGEFDKLRRCGECALFFVAAHRAAAYCSSKCQKAHDRKAAPARAEAWRAKKANKAHRAAEQKRYEIFFRFWELVNKRHTTREEGHEMNPILEALGHGSVSRGWQLVKQWQKPANRPEHIWENLTKEQRGIFTSAMSM